MASSRNKLCSPLDLYFNDVDTSKVLIAKTLATDSLSVDDLEFVTLIEDCCRNVVNGVYKPEGMAQLAIILFRHKIIDIRDCQDELKLRAPDIFVFEIDQQPEGLVVVNTDIDVELLRSYVKDRESGIGSNVRPKVLARDCLLVVTFRNTMKVIREVLSRPRRLFGQPLYFEPYYPAFHDSLLQWDSPEEIDQHDKSTIPRRAETLDCQEDLTPPDYDRTSDYPYMPYHQTEDDEFPCPQYGQQNPCSELHNRIRILDPDDISDDDMNFFNEQRDDGMCEDDLFSPQQPRRERHGPGHSSTQQFVEDNEFFKYETADNKREERHDKILDDDLSSRRQSRRNRPGPRHSRAPKYDKGDKFCKSHRRTGQTDDRRFDEGLSSCQQPSQNKLSPGEYSREQKFYQEDELHGDGEDGKEGISKKKGGRKEILIDKNAVRETIDVSTLCDDKQEQMILAVCLESAVGQKFVKHFEDNNDCKLKLEFIKEPTAPKRQYRRKTSKSKCNPAADLQMLQLYSLVCGNTNRLVLCPNQQLTCGETSESANVNGTKVKVKKGNVTNENAEVMVNVVGTNLNFVESRISQEYAKRGGKVLCQAFEQEKMKYAGDGVVVCHGGRLRCNYLLTAVLEKRLDESSNQKLAKVLATVFQRAAEIGAKSIALPVIGCGKMLQFPLQTVASLTIEETIKAVSGKRNKLKEVTIVAFDDEAFDKMTTALRTTNVTTGDSKVSERTVGCKVQILAHTESSLTETKQTFTKALRDKFLFSVNITFPKTMPLTIRTKAKYFENIEKHTDTPMKIDIDQTSRQIRLKGETSQVSETERHIKQSIFGGELKGPEKPLNCSPTCWYNLAHDSPVSPVYWTKFKGCTSMTNLSKSTLGIQRWALVPVDENTYKAIRDLVQKTWRPQLVGRGKDAINLSHRRIEVQKVERIENIDVFMKYNMKRHEHFRMLAEEGTPCLQSLEKSPVRNSGPILSTPKPGSPLHEEIVPEINEHYMFHGTKSDIVQTVLKEGLDGRLSDRNALFGTGIYCAESSTKADQYADPKHQRTPGSKMMLLVRMLLGNMFVCADQNPKKYRRPPCRETKCLRDDCTSGHSQFDSVVGDGPWLFREFVVYSAEQCYPEFLITYKRE